MIGNMWFAFVGLVVLYHLYHWLRWTLCRPDFTGKTVLITGASSGIGEELAKQMSLLNVKKLILSSRRAEELERVKQDCIKLGSKAQIEVKTLDLADPDNCLKWASEFGQTVDILVNNGGLSQRDLFSQCNFEIAKKLMNINCLSPIALIKGFLPQFLKNPRGALIVNVISVAGQIGVPIRSLYSASKFAIDGFGKALEGELSQTQVRVLQCYPAYVRTNISQNAMVGDGVAFGKTDENIQNGIPADEAVATLLKAMHLKRKWITLGSLYYVIVPKLMFVSETIYGFGARSNLKQQLNALKNADKSE